MMVAEEIKDKPAQEENGDKKEAEEVKVDDKRDEDEDGLSSEWQS